MKPNRDSIDAMRQDLKKAWRSPSSARKDEKLRVRDEPTVPENVESALDTGPCVR